MEPSSADAAFVAAVFTRSASGLPAAHSRLYSHATLLGAGGTGLPWRSRETNARLDDAVDLVDAALLARDAQDSRWVRGALRAAELLEWLSHPALNAEGLPTQMLAAACYQIAGYPARASGLIAASPPAKNSVLLWRLLTADFPGLLASLTEYWSGGDAEATQSAEAVSPQVGAELRGHIVEETARALGVLCGSMRWGEEARIDRALGKLESVGRVLAYGEAYSWLLARLTAEVARTFVRTALRANLTALTASLNQEGVAAFERYVRRAYVNCRAIAWPSQVRGIERLVTRKSFALCTPTGSGKTAVAEMALIQSLFQPLSGHGELMGELVGSPLALYLTPSRALAAEVESKLSSVLRGVADERIIVTGLYGGTDWGPTDAWLTAEDRAVLVCTYEKAEALLRFLGPLFVQRLTAIVIDEAHMVQAKKFEKGPDWDNRPLRLECLVTRLLAGANEDARVIALSAVAAGVENSLAQWMSGDSAATAAISGYRSTRQLVGRLECSAEGRFRISYDLLDGQSLTDGSESVEIGYVPHPIPDQPPAPKWDRNVGPEVPLRAHALWAAMHLAKHAPGRPAHAVLVSVTQRPEWFAKDFLELLGDVWVGSLPLFFVPPTDDHKAELWNRCLASCEDYFSVASYEFRLLRHGIVLHHGKMPGPMARLLTQVVEQGIVRIVLATSTLSEGVNLPFETVIVPSIMRADKRMNVSEFTNLIGRAGRPGSATEGRTLVLIDERQEFANRKRAYSRLVAEVSDSLDADSVPEPSSPLAQLIGFIITRFAQVRRDGQLSLEQWLESVAPIALDQEEDAQLIDAVDGLDKILLAVIVENERSEFLLLDETQLEAILRRVWGMTYAHHASTEEARLSEMFVRRGKAVHDAIYPHAPQRRRLYMTSLAPRPATALISAYPEIVTLLKTGSDYYQWSVDERIDFVIRVVRAVGAIPRFGLAKPPKRTTVENVMRWWFHRSSAVPPHDEAAVTEWYSYIHKNLTYKFAWGLGSVIGLQIDQMHEGELRATSLDEWPQTGLPWVVFWLKELVTWGTLEPVAAFLLGTKIEYLRQRAETRAIDYFESSVGLSRGGDEKFSATHIREWASGLLGEAQVAQLRPPQSVPAQPLRDFPSGSESWRVVPVLTPNQIIWQDVGGHPMARSELVPDWAARFVTDFDFRYWPRDQTVRGASYLTGQS